MKNVDLYEIQPGITTKKLCKNLGIITDDEIDGNLDGEALKSKKFEMSVIRHALTFYHNKKLLEQINQELRG